MDTSTNIHASAGAPRPRRHIQAPDYYYEYSIHQRDRGVPRARRTLHTNGIQAFHTAVTALPGRAEYAVQVLRLCTASANHHNLVT